MRKRGKRRERIVCPGQKIDATITKRGTVWYLVIDRNFPTCTTVCVWCWSFLCDVDVVFPFQPTRVLTEYSRAGLCRVLMSAGSWPSPFPLPAQSYLFLSISHRCLPSSSRPISTPLRRIPFKWSWMQHDYEVCTKVYSKPQCVVLYSLFRYIRTNSIL